MKAITPDYRPVIVVNTRFLLKSGLEGYGVYSKEILCRLVKLWPEARFVFVFDRPYDSQFLFAENVEAIALFPPARHPLLFLIWYEWSLANLLRRIRPHLFISMDGFMPLRYNGSSMLVIHDLAYLHFPQGISWSHLHYYRFFQPRFAKKASRLVTVSYYSKSDMINSYHIDPLKIDVIPNASRNIFSEKTEIEKKATRSIYSEGFSYFTTLGAIHPRKNLVNVLKAFDRWRNIHPERSEKLVVIGRNAWKNEGLQEILKSMKYKDHVIFTGYLEDNDLVDVLAASSALLYLSLFEGFGIPIIEAISCKVPVLTSSTSSMPEVGGGACLYADPQDIEAIAMMMEKILDNSVRTKLLSEGQKQIEKYQWDISAQLFLECIQKMVKH